MKVIVEIPDLKWAVGDIIYLPNTENQYGIYCKVKSWVMVLAEVYMNPSSKEYMPRIKEASYFIEIVLGSFCNGVELVPMAGYLTLGKQILETKKCCYVGHSDTPLLFDFNRYH